MALTEKYQSLIDIANQSGVSNLQVSEEGGALRVTGTAPSEEAKQKIWDEYNRIDPDMRSGDLVLNLEVGGGGGAGETYTVKSGDTLSKIAKQHYGDENQWRRIYDANRSVIGDRPDNLRVGTVLRIPPRQ